LPRNPVAAESGSDDDWWLWLSEDNDLQIRVEVDGRPVASCLVHDEIEPGDLSVLEQHRRNGMIRRKLRLGPVPQGAVSCTVTIVDPTN